jgi:ABC-2 type transport system ATP-binding protein
MKRKQILSDINLSIPPGTVLGLVGPNGAGKTTTIKLGAGLLEPDKGEVLIKGLPACTPSHRSCLGLLTETQYFYPHLRLAEWLHMMAGLSGLTHNRRKQRIEEVLNLLGLAERKTQMLKTLSKGQIQRAGLAQALVHEPEILLLDEPMSGLDPYWRYRVQRIMFDFKSSGGTILFSSHILVDVEKFSDQVALLENGRIKWTGKLSDLHRGIKGYEVVVKTDHPQMLKEYSGEANMIRHSEGGWLISIPEDQKDKLLKTASSGAITIESLLPKRDEIDEILFGLKGGS